MEKSKLREKDVKQSQILEEFLDKYLYNSDEFKSFKRHKDKVTQTQGVDVSFIFDDKEYFCDEKTAIQYVNKDLKTFALEISFLNRKKELTIGWFINDTLKTNSYMLVWIDKAIKDEITDVDDIIEVEVAFINKTDILSFLEKDGWDKNKLWKKSNNIRENDKEYYGNINREGYKFSYSPKFFEKPVNIIFPRQFYRDNCIFNKKIVSI